MSSLASSCLKIPQLITDFQTTIDVIPPNDCHKSSALSRDGHGCGSRTALTLSHKCPISPELSSVLKYRIFYKCMRVTIFVERKYFQNDLNIENKSFQHCVTFFFFLPWNSEEPNCDVVFVSFYWKVEETI